MIDLPVAHNADMEEVTELAGSTAAERVTREDLADDVLEEPEVLGVERITSEGVVLRRHRAGPARAGSGRCSGR